MVLELKVPQGEELAALIPLWPVFLSYLLSFIYVGLYWNNHHHLFQAIRQVNGGILWSNIHLLFWLSLMPFTTAWMGENHFGRWPTLLYGVNLFCCAVAYYLLQTCLIRHHGANSALAHALGKDIKGKISPVLYLLGIVLAALDQSRAGAAFFIGAAFLWLVPDTRIERIVEEQTRDDKE